ncbi:tetratricopeptide repeat protein [Ichthyenterobacterium magnum]|uniref:Uncharacterized protein n=1 Tax=Ichthyenterobacterium magnum TaxID=1230530 RepID=A0A420DUL6_9FLAO|nr:tetratricopeptide repeat protein [Ichthyenterobacterium magnum]RKE97952.1 hypothetical protein BXY80_0017 [Ichthyenterobacterium magnum]
MKIKTLLLSLVVAVIISSCSNKPDYTAEFKEQTSGRYLFTQEELIEVYYIDNTLFLKWKGAEKLEPVVLDNNVLFVADMYKKLHFVQHPETKKRYLAVLPENDDEPITYDYLKVADDYKTPSMHLKDKDYGKALEGYLVIKAQDSTSMYLNERQFNFLGYRHLEKKEFDNAIEVFKMNVALFPESANVYDSLAEAYLLSGDSLQAYTNYNKSLEFNNGNTRAKEFIEAYDKNL